MLRIRLTRKGKKRQPTYRVVVADIESPRDGRYVEQIGHYNPMVDPIVYKINEARALHWLSVGAQPSDAVKRLLDKQGTYDRLARLRAGEELGALVAEFDGTEYEAESADAGIVEQASEKVAEAVETVREAAEDAVEAVQERAAEALENAPEAVQEAVETVREAAAGVAAAASEVVDNITDRIADVLDGDDDAEVAEDAVEDVDELADDALDALAEEAVDETVEEDETEAGSDEADADKEAAA